MSSSLVAAGLGLAALGFGMRYIARTMPKYAREAEMAMKTGKLPVSGMNAYYKGGFDTKMSKREAGLILGVSPSANAKRVKDAHKRIMLLNHPDRGGSPYLAAKINEAKDYIDNVKT
ncbi:mitochondrial import inner membrane translocase subunit TIM14-like [Watersipora subatra]|uniref:mitochondrial import inner membrane translocase subunit TIM14-like n=1 Tax=Watersipora subatra TaxID=2589382 RepID=UPI00355C5434